MGDNRISIRVKFKDGTHYDYTVDDVAQAKRYAHSIINTGFRIKRGQKYTYYPVHKIDTVEVEGEGIERGPITEKSPVEPVTLTEKS